MGNWAIVIRGVGVHHNGDRLPEDANRMAAGFVETLKAAGHSVTEASFTHGGCDYLLQPAHPGWGRPTPLAIAPAE